MSGFGRTMIRLATSLVPLKSARKRLRARALSALRNSEVRRKLPDIRASQRKLVEACRARAVSGRRLRVAFLVCDASMFSAEPVFVRMREDPAYECFIAVAPRVTRGETFLRETLSKTCDTLRGRYGDAVRVFYDTGKRRALPLEGEADIVFTSIIYEEQSCPTFTVEAMSSYALVALISYGYSGLFKANLEQTIFLPNIVFAWKYFVSNRDTLDLWTGNNPQLEGNISLSGYAKMDRLAGIGPDTGGERKKIILAPHHSLARGNDGLSLSNFLRLSDFFLTLPERYPGIDFVFRPHPLLFPRLATGEWWGKERTLAYKEKISSFPNVEFQQGGDYFGTFARSSALIHDCGSFLAEYFYTSNPQCYILDEGTEKQFLPFGRKLLAHTYRARTERDILDFIDRVVVEGDDPMKSDRDRFASESVCVSYPHAADRIIGEISKTLGDRKSVV